MKITNIKGKIFRKAYKRMKIDLILKRVREMGLVPKQTLRCNDVSVSYFEDGTKIKWKDLNDFSRQIELIYKNFLK